MATMIPKRGSPPPLPPRPSRVVSASDLHPDLKAVATPISSRAKEFRRSTTIANNSSSSPGSKEFRISYDDCTYVIGLSARGNVDKVTKVRKCSISKGEGDEFGRQLTSSRVRSLNDWETIKQAVEQTQLPKHHATEAFDNAAFRLRYILHQLNRGELPLDDLKKNLEYAALVLETAYMDETRRLVEEEDELAEVNPDAVPSEVREWLASTFTRQQANRCRRTFKQVANAIRTGIFFDKMYRRMSSQTAQNNFPPEILHVLKDIDLWNFDIFKLNEISYGQALKYVGLQLFSRYGILTKYKIPFQVAENFMVLLEVGYSKHGNPYHNLIHGADVAQSTHWMISQTGLMECLSDLEIFATIVSALMHDYEHTGHTNNFHVQSGSDFAMLYNDRSVLENHHISSTFRLMKENDKNILANLTREEYREFRNLVIEIVLATDMSTHFTQVKTMKNMLALPESIDKVKALCLLVHCCDISHPAKSWTLHHNWTLRVLEEFFRQGDLEASLGLPYSPLCDRNTTHVADSQIGFIDFIVEPSLLVCGEMLTKMVEPLVSMHDAFDPERKTSQMLNDNCDEEANDTVGGLGRRLPLAPDGRLEIPQPWLQTLHENKQSWKSSSANKQ